MKNVKLSLGIAALIFTILLSNFPTSADAASYSNQQVTCYLANSSERPARPGYYYVVSVTAASQYKVYNNFSSGPRIPFGTWVTLSQTVDLLYPAEDTNRFRIDDMGDKYQTRTPYFVDVYFGAKDQSHLEACNKHGVKRMTVSF